MARFTFLHAADIHLDSPLRGLARSGELARHFTGASRRALENLVDKALADEVAFLVIAGDVYDGDWRDYATGQAFVRQMGRLAQAGIRVFVVRGNHDAESEITRALPLPENVHVFSTRAADTVRLDDLKVALHGRSFARRHVEENVALAYPAAVPGWLNIGVLHTSLTGREGHAPYAPCTVEDLRRAGYQYWALGHVHRREVVAEDPHIVFPGNLQGRHARETGPKGATLVAVDDGRITGLDAVILDAARFERLAVPLDGLDERGSLPRHLRPVLEAAVAEAERPLAVRLVLTGETPLAPALRAHPEALHEEIQAIASEVSDTLLIEAVEDRTAVPRTARLALGIPGFAALLDAAADDEAFRAEIARDIGALRAKAPPDVDAALDDDAAAAAAVEAARTAVATVLAGAEAEHAA